MKYEIKDTTYEDCCVLSKRLRQSDIEEIYNSNHFTPLEALLTGLIISEAIKSFYLDNELLFIYGVTKVTDNMYSVWLLGTDSVEKHGVLFYKFTSREIKKIFDKYKNLVNYVAVDNVKSIKWLKYLGFELDEPIPYGLEGKLFHGFYKFNE